MAAAAAAAMLGKTRSYGEDKPMKSRDSVSLNSMEALQELASRTWSSRRGRGTLAELLDKEQNQQQQQDASISASDPFTDADADASSYLCPAPPFVLRFSNLQYSVSAGGSFSRNPAQVVGFQHCGNAKLVLNDISGEARDGEIFAVLGHSGSGKSTLIDALAQRIRRGSLKGSVTLNGDPMNGNLFRSISAYVMQDDLLFPMLTVRETLLFAAEFRMPRGTAPEQKLQRVEALLDQLGLRGAAHTIIGDEGHRGVSGGERRRVSIGMDIIHDPILLFLDEPTSGLDSTSAFMVVKVLQRIARHGGSIVLMSIHQPSYRILGILDRVLLLAHGQTVFSGSPARLQPFFSAFGRPVPENGNSTEFALDLIQELESAPSGIKPLVEFHRSWADLDRDSALGPAVPPLADAVAQCVARGRLVAAADDSAKIARFANSAVTEIAILSRRSFTNMRRTPELFLMRLGMVMITGFLLATIFWKLDHSPKGVRERLSFFAFAMSTTFYTCADALPTFLQERYIFMRETAYNAYRRWSYVVAHALVSLPWLVVLATAFSAVTFWAVGLAGGASGFVYFTVMMLASFWAANSFVTFLSGAVPNLMIAYTIVVALLAYFLLLSGFFITRDRIPQYWIWFHYISLVKYPYEGVLQNEFHRPNACFARGTEVFDGTPMAALPSQMQESFLGLLRTTTNINITDETCVTTGIDVLQNQDITQLNKWQCLVVVAAWGFLFRFLFYVALLLGSKNKRR